MVYVFYCFKSKDKNFGTELKSWSDKYHFPFLFKRKGTRSLPCKRTDFGSSVKKKKKIIE